MPSQKRCLGGPSASKFTGIPGKNSHGSPLSPSLPAVSTPWLCGNGVALGVARENRHPKGWDLGVGFVWGYFYCYYFFIQTLAEKAKTFFSNLLKMEGLEVLS